MKSNKVLDWLFDEIQMKEEMERTEREFLNYLLMNPFTEEYCFKCFEEHRKNWKNQKLLEEQKMSANFYKWNAGQTELRFQLLETNCEESYSVWDNTKKMFLRGDQLLDDNLENPMLAKDSKWLKNADFKARFPNMTRKNQFIRLVAVEGQAFNLGLTKTVNDQMLNLFKTFNTLGTDPLEVEFLLRKEGSGLETEYFLEVVGKKEKVLESVLEANQTYHVSEMPSKASNLPLNETLQPKGTKTPFKLETPKIEPNAVTLDLEEKELLEAFDRENNFFQEKEFVDMWIYNYRKQFGKSVKEDRVKQIYSQFYNEN